MINILVTGSNGQLGSEFKELVAEYEYKLYFSDSKTVDICDKNAIENFVQENSINAIINCAAYTAVDKAEVDEENADRVNHLAVKNLAQISKEKNIKLIHISTDYVFDGKHYKPYTEEDETAAISVYGITKLAGEEAVQKINPKNSIIIRTSWVYSSYGNNFLKVMLQLGRQRESLVVVNDQVGTPTYAADIAKSILEILPNIKNEKVEIYNYSNEGVLSWYDFAKEIMKMAKIDCQINPIETKEYLALYGAKPSAHRPYYSLLNKAKIRSKFGVDVPFWKDSLDKCLRKMGER